MCATEFYCELIAWEIKSGLGYEGFDEMCLNCM